MLLIDTNEPYLIQFEIKLKII